MTREQFLSQYTGEWSPSDGHWFGLDFGWRGQEYRFQTDSMYHPANTVLPDGREARFGVYKKEGSAYALIGEYATPQEALAQCRIQGMPAGIGDPVFEKLNANLAKAICSIGAVKGFEIGDGFSAARSQGSVNNDAFTTDAAGHITKATNHAGGILGGMSDSSEIIFRAAIKPTPSISRTQHTVTREGEPIDIQIKGRHDPIIVPRAVVVVQSMAALVLIDALMQNMTARVDYLRDFYKN